MFEPSDKVWLPCLSGQVRFPGIIKAVADFEYKGQRVYWVQWKTHWDSNFILTTPIPEERMQPREVKEREIHVESGETHHS
jgi:hypothetical protein